MKSSIGFPIEELKDLGIEGKHPYLIPEFAIPEFAPYKADPD